MLKLIFEETTILGFHDSLPHSISKLSPAKNSTTHNIPLVSITFPHQQNKEIEHTIKRVIEGVLFLFISCSLARVSQSQTKKQEGKLNVC